MHRTGLPIISSLLFTATALADLTVTFEPPDFAGSAAGTLLTGQAGWYLPAVVGSVDHNCFTYAGNAYGFPANPGGGDQFDAGRSQGTTLLARAQHAHDFSTSPVWCISWDFACKNDNADPATRANNIGSFSDPTGITGAPGNRGFIALNTWNNFASPPTATGWSAGYIVHDAAGVQTPQPGLFAGPEWQNLDFDVWYRQTTQVSFALNRIVRVTITNLTTGATASAQPVGWYHGGGSAPGALPLPTDVRMFTGGSVGNITAWDNVLIRSFPADINGDGSVGLSDLAALLSSFGLVLGETGYNPAADLNGDNQISLDDLALLLANFGSGCGPA